ncbi:uncharacterized protein LOC124436734 [Xenia sp. Carnegie-2017]|uniref:uncharacterized protein LOC124436734 n=1 Tax=Xenia sp. Carnegie-2017 TaxID=2897299 RepID=UPI001F037BA3|nr:uncharacterized protein LOC124436734 [Xenia sp. Carnegie-2017]
MKFFVMEDVFEKSSVDSKSENDTIRCGKHPCFKRSSDDSKEMVYSVERLESRQSSLKNYGDLNVIFLKNSLGILTYDVKVKNLRGTVVISFNPIIKFAVDKDVTIWDIGERRVKWEKIDCVTSNLSESGVTRNSNISVVTRNSRKSVVTRNSRKSVERVDSLQTSFQNHGVLIFVLCEKIIGKETFNINIENDSGDVIISENLVIKINESRKLNICDVENMIQYEDDNNLVTRNSNSFIREN